MNWQEFNTFLELCLNSNIFEFETALYKQTSGVPIGGNASPFIADLWVNYVHEKVFSKFDIKFVAYYVDDSLVVLKEELVTEVLAELNAVHPNVKYTVEKEHNNSIPFLDIRVNKLQDGSILTNLYRKPQKSTRTINYNSHHPKYQKTNLIKNEIKRAISLTNDQCTQEDIKDVVQTFTDNGYPLQLIDETIMKALNPGKNNKNSIEVPKIRGSIPFIPQLSEIIKQHLRVFGIEVTYSIIRPLSHITNNKTSTDFLKKKNVVYAIPCKSCKKNNKNILYVGETLRPLQERLKEHFQSVAKQEPKTALSQHALEEHHEFDLENTKILYTERDTVKRRFCESFFISVYDRHSINHKTDIEKSSLVYNNVLAKIRKDFYNIEQFSS